MSSEPIIAPAPVSEESPVPNTGDGSKGAHDVESKGADTSDISDAKVPQWIREVCVTPESTRATLLSKQGSKKVMRAVLTSESNMWDNGQVITVAFVAPARGTQNQRNKIKELVKIWEKYANIKFKFVEGEKAMVRITLRKDGGNWSTIGRAILNKKGETMNLHNIRDTEDINHTDSRAVLHEFGHTIGLLHEHQSPRRGEVLNFDIKAAYEYFGKNNNWSEERVRHEVLTPVAADRTSNYSAFDIKSIMLYSMPARTNKEGKKIELNWTLSKLDKAFVTINYPTFSGHTSGMTVQQALDAAGVTGKPRQSILDSYGRKDWKEMRSILSKWVVSARTACKSGAVEQEGSNAHSQDQQIEDDDDDDDDDEEEKEEEEENEEEEKEEEEENEDQGEEENEEEKEKEKEEEEEGEEELSKKK